MDINYLQIFFLVEDISVSIDSSKLWCSKNRLLFSVLDYVWRSNGMSFDNFMRYCHAIKTAGSDLVISKLLYFEVK